jgi:multidrug efflux system membrane fusion protein
MNGHSLSWGGSTGQAKVVTLIVIFALVVFVIIAHLASGRKPVPKRRIQAAPVTVAEVTQKDIPVELRAIGRVEPYASVTIKSRVNGELQRVHFREGQQVKAGDLLFTIDPRPFEAELQEAKARLAKDVALAKKAEKDLQRNENLAKGGYVSEEQFEQIRANVEALNATIEADRAQVESVRLQLGYCYIRSPITGRIGSLQIDQGSMIKANDDTGMVEIVQIMPIYVDFSVPELHLPDVKKYQAQGPLRVAVVIPNEDSPPEQGHLTFMDNKVNQQTGTIRLRGTFANRSTRLWPGQFVKVVLTLTTQTNATVIPYQAIQKGQSGEFVYVLKADLTVEPRPVSVSMTREGEAVIEKGLTPGERVVTDGQIRLFQGAKVEIKGESTGEGEKTK